MTREEALQRIVVDPTVCSGRPCIHGTRIDIAIILDGLFEGLTFEQVIDHYPHLTKEDIQAALAYAGERERLEGLGPMTKRKLDENLSRHLKEPIAAFGYDVPTATDEGLFASPDFAVGAAAKERRILPTLDVAFADLRKHRPGMHPSIVLSRPRTMGPLTVNALVRRCFQENDMGAFAGCVVVVDPARIRVRRPRPAQSDSD